MSEVTLDAAEAARITLTEAAALARLARRLVSAADLLERAATSFAHGLVVDRPPDGHDLLSRYGASAECVAACLAALRGLEDGLEGIRFAFEDEPEPVARLRARALDELRLHLERRRAGDAS